MRRAILLCGSFLLAFSAADLATAGGCNTFSGLPTLYGYGVSGNLYGLGRIPTPPYFALHPPVYYSEQVARPYGLSPFAYRSAPVEAHRAQPAMITNPFVQMPAAPKTRDAKDHEDRVTKARDVIINPYFSGAMQVARE